METKICRQCEMLKNVNDFYTKHAMCKNCAKLESKKYNQENKEKRHEIQKRYYQKNKERISIKKKEYQKKYHLENRETLKEYSKKKYHENKEYYKKYTKEIINSLHPQYLKFILKQKGFNKNDIESNPMLIELQRAITINKRLTKKNNQNE